MFNNYEIKCFIQKQFTAVTIFLQQRIMTVSSVINGERHMEGNTVGVVGEAGHIDLVQAACLASLGYHLLKTSGIIYEGVGI